MFRLLSQVRHESMSYMIAFATFAFVEPSYITYKASEQLAQSACLWLALPFAMLECLSRLFLRVFGVFARELLYVESDLSVFFQLVKMSKQDTNYPEATFRQFLVTGQRLIERF